VNASLARTNDRLIGATACLLFGTAAVALNLQTVLGAETTATTLMSRGLWQRTVLALGGTLSQLKDGRLVADLDLVNLFLPTLVVACLCWIGGASFIAGRTKQPLSRSLATWGVRGWLWWCVPGAWEILRLIAFATGLESIESLLLATPNLWVSLMLAGWLATFAALSTRPSASSEQPQRTAEGYRVAGIVWVAAGLYVLVFTAMNWQLYRGLLVPHGDSAMYEEHLWNLTHGKGFRSYLDQGLFLGEHVQVIHLLLIPLYVIWPSHLLLELCESLCLASGAVPLFWMARRHTGSDRAAALLAVAYLLYFPMQFLDVAIDLKTFRPTSFGVPAMLFAIDRMERGRYRAMCVFGLLALAAKEDYAAIIVPLGVWMACRKSPESSRSRRFGLCLAVFGLLYLATVIVMVIPAFRQGADVHYVRYFGELGDSPGDIVRSLATQPALVLGKLFSIRSAIYALMLLVPLGCLGLLAPGRLLTAAPLFAVLCLLEFSTGPGAASGQPIIPYHHFHAPLVPLLCWAAAAGLGNVGAVWVAVTGKRHRENLSEAATAQQARAAARLWSARFVCASALATGFFSSLSPLGLSFWDSSSEWYWRDLYVPGRRAELFTKVFQLIGPDARVAATDFVHPRFTHHERSYDYSNYPRAVNNGKPGAPPDTDYIVIDTQHRYSKIKSPDQVPEFREHPQRWELLPDETDGYFIVLKRVAK